MDYQHNEISITDTAEQKGSTWIHVLAQTPLRKKAIWVMELFVPGSGFRGPELSVERAVANKRVSDG